MEGEALSGTLGWTLDPVCAVRLRIELPPHGRRELAFVTIAAASHQSTLAIAERYTTLASPEWAVSDAATDTPPDMHALGLAPALVPQAHNPFSLLLSYPTHFTPSESHRFPRCDPCAL